MKHTEIIYQGKSYQSADCIRSIPTVTSIKGFDVEMAKEDPHIPPVIKQKLGPTRIFSYRGANLPPSIETYHHVSELAKIIRYMGAHQHIDTPTTIVDVGTGSGLAIISLANELHDYCKNNQGVRLIATDISGLALEVADLNAQVNRVDDINFRKRDVLNGLVAEFGKIDVIMCNPPFFESSAIDQRLKRIDYVPIGAIDGGTDGLEFYRKLFIQSNDALSDEGVLLVQHQAHQLVSVASLTAQYLPGRESVALRRSKNGQTASLIGSPKLVSELSNQGMSTPISTI